MFVHHLRDYLENNIVAKTKRQILVISTYKVFLGTKRKETNFHLHNLLKPSLDFKCRRCMTMSLQSDALLTFTENSKYFIRPLRISLALGNIPLAMIKIRQRAGKSIPQFMAM